MTRSSPRQSLMGCRLMIALAILGTGSAPPCDAGRFAPTVGGFLPDADHSETLAYPDTASGSGRSSVDADLPANGDDESSDYASGPVLLIERRANPRPPSVWAGSDRVLTLAPQRSINVLPVATPRATDLPTWLCRWTC